MEHAHTHTHTHTHTVNSDEGAKTWSVLHVAVNCLHSSVECRQDPWFPGPGIQQWRKAVNATLEEESECVQTSSLNFDLGLLPRPGVRSLCRTSGFSMAPGFQEGFTMVLDSLGLTAHACILSCVWFFVTPWAAACQAPPSMGFSRQGYWRGLPFPPPPGLIT